MQLEDYFEFEKLATKHGIAERIRLKGTRVDVEVVVRDFNEGKTPGEIQASYPTMTLEQVFAAITYYLHNKPEVDAYVARGEKVADAFYQEYLDKGPFFLRDEAAALKAAKEGHEGAALFM
jgi:uncharacterized protein (DUF433 family)